MKISQAGLQTIANRIQQISEKLNEYAGMKILNAEQREDFRDLQEEFRRRQREYRTFSDPMAGK